MRHSVGVVMMTNASSFVPVQQKSDDERKKAMSMVELREQDDEYYDHTDGINIEHKTPHFTYVEHF